MESSDINKIFLSLSFYGFTETTDEISKKLGLEPTEVWLKDEVKQLKMGYHKFRENTWSMKTTVGEHRPIEEHVEQLLKTMRPHRESISLLAKKYDSELWFALYANKANPVIRLSPEIMKELSEFSVPVAFDLYMNTGEDPEAHSST